MEHPTLTTGGPGSEGEVYTFPEAYGMQRSPIRSRLTAGQPQMNGLQGLEVESAVIDMRTGEPVDMSSLVHEIAARLNEQGFQDIKPEVCASVVEQNIAPGTLEEVEASFIREQAALSHQLEREGLIALPIGMIPHGNREAAQARLWENMQQHPDPFYQNVLIPRDGRTVEALAYMSGIQPHTEQLHGETAVTAVRALSLLSPFFIALAASSPVINGHFRGRHSERMVEKNSLRRDLTGLIPEEAVRSHASMQAFLHGTSQNPEFLSIAPGYFWVRQPRIEIGTVETATMDAIPDPGHALWMCRLSRSVVQAVARDMREGRSLPQELFGDSQLHTANRTWVHRTVDTLQTAPIVQAAQFTGLDGHPTTMIQFLNRLMDWTETTSSDRSQIHEFLEDGTVAERMMDELRLTVDKPQEVDNFRIKDLCLQWADHYHRRLRELSGAKSSLEEAAK